MKSPDAASVGRGYLAKVRSAIHRFPKLPKAAARNLPHECLLEQATLSGSGSAPRENWW